MPKKKKTEGDPEVHEELKGFDIKVNEFGEIVSNVSVDKINDFLNDKVDDKKFRESNEGEKAEDDEEEE